MFLLAKMLILGEPLPVFGPGLIISGISLVVLFNNPQKNILRIFNVDLITLALSLISSFGEVVSYIRLFAVGMAGVAIADAFNAMAASIGVGIHGYVPENFMASLMGKSVWWSVPAAVLIGVPMYSNAAGILPVVQALLGKGAALGTVMAFMMSVIALSAPEMIILRKVLKPRLIAVFAGVVATGIMIVGYVFNLLL